MKVPERARQSVQIVDDVERRSCFIRFSLRRDGKRTGAW